MADWNSIRNNADSLIGPPQLFGQNWGSSSGVSDISAQSMGMPSLDTGSLGLPSFNAGASGNWWDGALGKTLADGTKVQGWGGAALGVAQGIGNAFMGMKQYGLAKDQLAQSKKQFDLNFGAQQKTTNAALEDRQAARVASNPGAYQSVGDYMKKNGI